MYVLNIRVQQRHTDTFPCWVEGDVGGVVSENDDLTGKPTLCRDWPALVVTDSSD